MLGASELLSDLVAPRSLAFGAGVAIAVGVAWQLRPADVFSSLAGQIGLFVLVGALATVLLSERYRETVRREPGYFASGLAMGLVLAARLFT